MRFNQNEIIEAYVETVEEVQEGEWTIKFAGLDTWISVHEEEGLGKPQVGDIVYVMPPRIVGIYTPGNSGVNPYA